MSRRQIQLLPANPERNCWGCDKYCPAEYLACGNGTIRTLHPCELFGDDWLAWSARDRCVPVAAGDHAAVPGLADSASADTEWM